VGLALRTSHVLARLGGSLPRREIYAILAPLDFSRPSPAIVWVSSHPQSEQTTDEQLVLLVVPPVPFKMAQTPPQSVRRAYRHLLSHPPIRQDAYRRSHVRLVSTGTPLLPHVQGTAFCHLLRRLQRS